MSRTRIATCAKGPWRCTRRYGFGLWHAARRADGVPVGMCGLLKRDILPDVDSVTPICPHTGVRVTRSRRPKPRCGTACGNFGLQRVHRRGVGRDNAASIRVLEKLGMRFERMYPMHPGEPEVRLYGGFPHLAARDLVADDLADLRAGFDVQLHWAVEAQLSVDHAGRADAHLDGRSSSLPQLQPLSFFFLTWMPPRTCAPSVSSMSPLRVVERSADFGAIELDVRRRPS